MIGCQTLSCAGGKASIYRWLSDRGPQFCHTMWATPQGCSQHGRASTWASGPRERCGHKQKERQKNIDRSNSFNNLVSEVTTPLLLLLYSSCQKRVSSPVQGQQITQVHECQEQYHGSSQKLPNTMRIKCLYDAKVLHHRLHTNYSGERVPLQWTDLNFQTQHHYQWNS